MIETQNTPRVIINIDRIPPLTRFIRLSLHSYSIDKCGYCIIDNVQFSVVRNDADIRLTLQRIFYRYSRTIK